MHLASRLVCAAATVAFIFTTMEARRPDAALRPVGEAAGSRSCPRRCAPWKERRCAVNDRHRKAARRVCECDVADAPDGSVAAKSYYRHGGCQPLPWFDEVAEPRGMWHATLALDHATADAATFERDIS